MTGPFLVALDVDGTLISYDGELSTDVRGAVGDLVAAGHHVVIATGRSVHSTVPIYRALDPTAGWRAHEVVTFDPTFAVRLLVEEFPGVRFAVEELGAGYRLNAPFPDGELSGQIEVVDLDELCSRPVTRLVVRAPDHTDEEFDRVVGRLGLHDVTYSVGYNRWLDIAPAGISKASALEAVRRELDVAPERTVAVGDGGNDLEMLGWAARGVAMGHAAREVRAAADEVTGTIDDDGLVPVLRSLVGRP